ncbi:hypothetical protein [Actinoplanes derwentensis]|uniref:Uncharacterized protein n=1 Tax=Actinoplanes derwentensis TaxID=113562 RepID=A0A1H2AJ30_9ACTN|nr:hypothetical protein [Actinoplanes derwentensis]SDT45546.1 hypothetical protein SAMN04489716_3877 [Actinoplanes derwentensis]
MRQPGDTTIDIALGVLLEESALPEPDDLDEPDETGHVPAAGYRGRHTISTGRQVAQIGNDVLRAAAEAVGSEVALVVGGIVAGIESRVPAGAIGTDPQSYEIGDVELKFGVKATLGAGKAVQAFLTATGEATVEVTLKLRRPQPNPG